MDSAQFKKEIGERLKQARGALGMTQKEMCESYGIKLPSLRDYELGNSIPGGEAIADLMRAGINANWLLTGVGSMRMADITQAGIATADRVYAPIPRYLVKGKNGYEVEIASEVVSLALDRQWLDQLGIRPADLVYVRMPDDSMEPSIRSGGLVVTDGGGRLRGDGIYCLMLNGDIVVKRLQLDFSGGVWVRGDNPAYKEQHVDQGKLSASIVGKVIWSGGAL